MASATTPSAGRKALKRLVVSATDYSQEAGRQAMAKLLKASPDLDAVFAASDLLASGALVELRQPLELVAREMVEVLLRRIDGTDDGPRILPTELVVRASAPSRDVRHL
ncbi:hypothetical protein E0H73_16225 [Kribbella pittospori]|uniref:LacI family transcriptional regulator n=1 Tax=Kribbella pittospori TaxID=722689 RepID=A0A4R0KPT4_9ACTN|nr:hypothetical protein [Kribbella pittospori]TCC62250.1 hypothetical protein E0H73_16225 [Kribbella pittospori]